MSTTTRVAPHIPPSPPGSSCNSPAPPRRNTQAPAPPSPSCHGAFLSASITSACLMCLCRIRLPCTPGLALQLHRKHQIRWLLLRRIRTRRSPADATGIHITISIITNCTYGRFRRSAKKKRILAVFQSRRLARGPLPAIEAHRYVPRVKLDPQTPPGLTAPPLSASCQSPRNGSRIVCPGAVVTRSISQDHTFRGFVVGCSVFALAVRR